MNIRGLEKLAIFWRKRKKFRPLPKDPQKANKLYNDPSYVASEKKDGTWIFGEIRKDRKLHLIARNKSVTGDYIDRTRYAPNISQKKYSKKLIGTKVIGELYHPKGFTPTSRILNSTPDNAVTLQKSIGALLYMPFDIFSYGGHNLKHLTYGKRLDMLKKFVNKSHNDDLTFLKYTYKNKKSFADKIKDSGGEGVVLVKSTAPGFGHEWYKDKKRIDFDLKIVGLTPGTGKYTDKYIGAFIVQDASGNFRSKVGIGLTDELRRDAYKYPERYLGRIAKIEAMELTKNSLRHPKFLGFEDKTTPDCLG